MAKRRGLGEGAIYQREDGLWVGAINLGWVDGKRRRKTVAGKTRQEVQGKVSLLTAQKQQGIPPADDRLTVKAFLDRWLENTAKPAVRYSTYRGYEQIVRCHLVPELGKIRLAKLSADDVEAFCNRALTSGRVVKPKEDTGSPDTGETSPPPDTTLSPRTVQYCHAVLRMALQTALKRGLVHRNVAALVSAPKVSREPVEPFTVAESRKFIEKAAGEPLEALYVVTLALGLRRGEVLGLKWDAIDLEQSRVWVRWALQRQKKQGLVLVEPKSRSSRRPLALPPFVVATLKDHRKRQAEQRLAAGPKWQDTGHLFTMEDGRPMSPEFAYKEFCRFLERAELRHVRFHDLRHSCASLLFAQGCSLRLVMEILGHSQIALTANTYTHLLPEADREAAHAMQALLGSKG
jgi:integrase